MAQRIAKRPKIVGGKIEFPRTRTSSVPGNVSKLLSLPCTHSMSGVILAIFRFSKAMVSVAMRSQDRDFVPE